AEAGDHLEDPEDEDDPAPPGDVPDDDGPVVPRRHVDVVAGDHREPQHGAEEADDHQQHEGEEQPALTLLVRFVPRRGHLSVSLPAASIWTAYRQTRRRGSYAPLHRHSWMAGRFVASRTARHGIARPRLLPFPARRAPVGGAGAGRKAFVGDTGPNGPSHH